VQISGQKLIETPIVTFTGGKKVKRHNRQLWCGRGTSPESGKAGTPKPSGADVDYHLEGKEKASPFPFQEKDKETLPSC